MNTYVFQQEQRGLWGFTLLPKRVAIKAVNEDEAWIKIKLREDFGKRLRNGDIISWNLVTSPVLLDDLVDLMDSENAHDQK